jgi:hypothetical protein
MFSFYNELHAQDIKKDSFPYSLITAKDTLKTIDGLEALNKLELQRKHEVVFYDSISYQLECELKKARTKKKKDKLKKDIRVYSQKKQIVEKVYLLNKKDLMAKYQLQSNDSVPNTPDSSGK